MDQINKIQLVSDYSKYFDVHITEDHNIPSSYQLLGIVYTEKIRDVTFQAYAQPSQYNSCGSTMSLNKQKKFTIPLFVYGRTENEAIKHRDDRLNAVEKTNSEQHEQIQLLNKDIKTKEGWNIKTQEEFSKMETNLRGSLKNAEETLAKTNNEHQQKLERFYNYHGAETYKQIISGDKKREERLLDL